ncbi:MAG: ABC transporter permease [Actinobacteria bacterium]|nr:ABC transporter permease [Actinomycetota bacterium]
MGRYVLRRVLVSIPVLVLASVLVFVVVRSFGVDPARARCATSRDPACIERVRERLGLDRPLAAQYLDEMRGVLTGDWGQSLRSDRSVAAAIGDALAETAPLVGWAMLVSLVAAVVIGVSGARRPGSRRDHTYGALAIAGLAVPTFWLGLLVIQLFTYDLPRWLGLDDPVLYSVPDPTGRGAVAGFRELALPVLVLSVQLVAGWSRYQRAALIDELQTDHVRTARAKGLTERRVVWKHGLRGASTSLVTVVALDAGALIGGVVITERVFSRPGMGTLLVNSVRDGDTRILIPWLLVAGAVVVVANLVADIGYAWLDPRVRVTGERPA